MYGLPRTVITSRMLPVLRVLTKLAGIARRPDGQATSVDADVSVRVFRPASARHPSPALLWINGGGMVLGAAAQDSRFCRRIAGTLQLCRALTDRQLSDDLLEQGLRNALALLGADHHS